MAERKWGFGGYTCVKRRIGAWCDMASSHTQSMWKLGGRGRTIERLAASTRNSEQWRISRKQEKASASSTETEMWAEKLWPFNEVVWNAKVPPWHSNLNCATKTHTHTQRTPWAEQNTLHSKRNQAPSRTHEAYTFDVCVCVCAHGSRHQFFRDLRAKKTEMREKKTKEKKLPGFGCHRMEMCDRAKTSETMALPAYQLWCTALGMRCCVTSQTSWETQ